MNSTIVGVGLAKKDIQVCVVENNKVTSNKEMMSTVFGGDEEIVFVYDKRN